MSDVTTTSSGALQLAIVTPMGKAFAGPVTQVLAPGVIGSFGVMRGPAAFLSALELGIVRVLLPSEERQFVVDQGFFEVRNNQATVLANWAEPATDPANAAELLKTRRAQSQPKPAAH